LLRRPAGGTWRSERQNAPGIHDDIVARISVERQKNNDSARPRRETAHRNITLLEFTAGDQMHQGCTHLLIRRHHCNTAGKPMSRDAYAFCMTPQSAGPRRA
jgi:hypothetical protein